MTVVLSKQSATSGPNTVAIAVSVPLAVIIVIVLAVLGYVGSRHCALRNSLQNFERTRYNSRTDSGVFGALGESFG